MSDNRASQNGTATPVIRDAIRELRQRPRHLWLELVRADQSDRWRNGHRILAEEYFRESTELRDNTEEALVLICGEIHLRRERGEQPGLEEYQGRFPELAAEIAIQFDVDRMMDDDSSADFTDDTCPQSSSHLPELAGYEFLEQIGRGASSVVYRARQISLDRHVAVKVLTVSVADPKRLARQRQEAEILARLKHPNVVHVYEVLDHAGCLYMVMEYVEGDTLQKLAAGKPMPPADAARCLLALAETIQVVHEAGVLHRDLKPSNILVASDQQIRITDFGLAKLRLSDNLVTTEDSVLGTPSYMSPEQAMGRAHEGGSAMDIYSLGCILYELLTGRPPFLGATVLDTLSLIRDRDPVPPSELQPNTPADLQTICLHCLRKSPTDRYATAADLAADVRHYLAGEPILARPITSTEKAFRWCRRNPLVAALAGTIVVLMIVAIAMLTAKNARIEREAAAKDSALATARQAVDQMLKRVADEELSSVPLGHPLRAQLLQDALGFYDGFLAQGDKDTSLREEMAAVLDSKGCIERELGRHDDARHSFERSIALLNSIVASDPHPPTIAEKIAAAQEALAYSWQINPAAIDKGEADANYRAALESYHKLEREWPMRRQPVMHCLRHLADLAFNRDERGKAEDFWREAIASGDAFLEQHPDHVDARANVCWACADLSDSILLPATDRAKDAEPILQKGISHAAAIITRAPNSAQGREVHAYLNYCLAQCYQRTGRGREAVGIYQNAAAGMESLCGECPWNQSYWDLAQHLHHEIVTGLHNGGQTDDARNSLQKMIDWAVEVAPSIPEGTVPRAEFQETRAQLVGLLRAVGQENEAIAVGAKFSTEARGTSRTKSGDK